MDPSIGKGVNSSASTCSECGSEDIVIVKARKEYCRRCWKHQCAFRFRKRLFELSRPPKGTVGEVFRPAEHVLICYDGSPSSVALINLALNALMLGNPLQGNASSSTNLPFPFKFCILVLLESDLNGSPGVEGRQKQHLQSLLKWTRYAAKVAELPFPLLASSLELSLLEYSRAGDGGETSPFVLRLAGSEDDFEGMKNDTIVGVPVDQIDNVALPFNECLDHRLMELRKSLKGKTEDKDFVTVLKKNLVYQVANHLEISKILLPEDQTSLAVKMFTMMSLGRGCQVADEMSFSSILDNGTVVARALIDFSSDDLQGYLDALDSECTDGIVKKSTRRKMKIDSVERQCDDFIVNLQKGYPATVSTLTRIGGKLQTSSSGEYLTQRCKFCKRLSDSNTSAFCYGCQNFLVDSHPDKKEYFRHLFS